MSQESSIAPRATEIVRTYGSIEKRFGIGVRLVKKYEDEGAPIVRDDRGVPSCEMWELWCWIRKRAEKRKEKRG
ncbi:hypothetical protein [Maridesulfovibrio sp.]|uniref:hypothetical protein n=1 Tax=Maridesulfovibrio sp. TaxID=2795000 RepID=UPI0029CAA740|nr:hypothetical protein [Maridesulfovibrio sp.]